MKRSLASMMAVLLIGINLMLSACGRSFEPGTAVVDHAVRRLAATGLDAMAL